MTQPEAPPRENTRDLQEMLAQRIRSAEEASRANGGEISSADLDAIDRLKRLVELSNTSRFERSARWIAAAVVALGIAASAALLTIHMSRVAITLDAHSSYIGFRPVTGLTVLAPLLPATTVSATRLDSVVVSGRVGKGDTTLQEHALDLATQSGGTMSLAALDVQPGQPVRIGLANGELQLSVGDSAGSAKLELNGPVTLRAAQQQTLVTRGGSARLWHGAHGGDLIVHLADTAARALTSVARIDALQLHRVAQQSANGARDSSTIADGKLAIPSIPDAVTALGPAEALQLEGLDGDLRSVQLQSGLLAVSYVGTARGMYATDGITRRTLMPTLFTYARSQHTVVLLWSAIAWVIGTILALLRWWRRPT